MKKNYARAILIGCIGIFSCLSAVAATVTNPQAVSDLINRIGGTGAADRFVTVVDPTLATSNKETFVITSQDGKPCIKGSNAIAVTTGLNWYLNHYAHINLAWNNLTTDLLTVKLPVPAQDETRQCAGDCRYYMNYCTLSYSCAPWTWDRWQKEIDWMALHGINMPLMGVGMEAVWRNIMIDLGYSEDDVNSFVPGPSYQAWWLMGNLTGWGGANPKWWYARQEALAKKILARERSLDMKPVLPGFAGLVPIIFMTKSTDKMTWSADVKDGGGWVDGFKSPAMIDPNSANFEKMAEIFYTHQKALMGTSKYYSMDLLHEGSGGDILKADTNKVKAFTKTVTALDTNIGDTTQWVVQHWLGNPTGVLKSTVAKKRMVVLNLYADATSDWNGSFGGHDMVFCVLNNFGGKVGMHGRLQRTISQYYSCRSAYGSTTLRGVGATPEGIENNPVLFDALFEMPWRTSMNMNEWLAEYAKARYGTDSVSKNLAPAWQLLGNSIYNHQEISGLSSSPNQGPAEAVFCARPSLTADKASSWGFCNIGWDVDKVRMATYNLLEAKNEELLKNANYQNDVVETTRQSLVDYSVTLLAQMNTAFNAKNTTAFKNYCNRFLGMILDMDTLLNTNPNCMLGKWTEQAKSIADEPEARAAGATDADKVWLEKNARMLISTWDQTNGSLADYSNRLWGGMLKDYYYPRWKSYLADKQAGSNGTTGGGWYSHDWAWANNHTTTFPTTSQGDAYATALKVFNKYFGKFYLNNELTAMFAFGTPDVRTTSIATLKRAANFNCSITAPDDKGYTMLYIDFNGNGSYSNNEIFVATKNGTLRNFNFDIPTTSKTGLISAKIVESGATGEEIANFQFKITISASITPPNSVTIDNWILPCTTNSNKEITLGTPQVGSGILNIPETFSYIGIPYKITGFAEGALQGQQTLSQLILPANFKSFAPGKALTASPFKGCTALTGVSLTQGNTAFQVIDNILYNAAADTLIGCPVKSTQKAANLPTTLKSVLASAFEGVTGVERIVPAATAPAALGTDAFKSSTVHVSVPVATADAYATAWAQPLLLSVPAGTTLTTVPKSTLDVLEINQTPTTTGNVTATVTPTYGWLTYTFATAKEFVPLYFGNDVTAVVTTDSTEAVKTLNLGTDFIAYKWANSAFTKATALKAGGYLILPSASYVGKPITFRANGDKLVVVPSGMGLSLDGNLTYNTVSPTGYVYQYLPTDDKFVLKNTLTIPPFGAFLETIGNAPQEVAGTGYKTGIRQITTSAKITLYDLSGRKIQAVPKGVYIKNGKTMYHP